MSARAARDRPPAADGRAVRDSDRPAGIVSRGIAAIVDVVVVMLILVGCYFVVVVWRLLTSVRHFAFPQMDSVFTVAGFVVISVVYLASCWAVSGRTPGAVLMGLRVVDRRGKTPRPMTAVLRALFCTFFAAGLFWSAIDARRRSVPDVVMRTRVVYSR